MPRLTVTITDAPASADTEPRFVAWSGSAEGRTAAEEAAYQAWERRYGVGSVPVDAVMRVTELAPGPNVTPPYAAPTHSLRRGLEERATHLGHDYANAQRRDEAAATRQIITDELVPNAAAADIRIESLARILGVSRQTLQRWRHEMERRTFAAQNHETHGASASAEAT